MDEEAEMAKTILKAPVIMAEGLRQAEEKALAEQAQLMTCQVNANEAITSWVNEEVDEVGACGRAAPLRINGARVNS